MGNRSSSIPPDAHFVVVGAGYGGVAFARALRDSGAKFTLVNERDSFHHNVASVRAAVVKGFAKKTLIPLKEVFGENFKQGRVEAIDKDHKTIKLESGEEISYDVLIIATGSSGRFPNKLSNQDAQTATVMYEETAAKVERAGRILIVGGGATGTEISCEIATKYPAKEVTLISSNEKLISDQTSEKYQERLNSILQRLKVKVIKGERVNGLDDIDENPTGPIKVTTDKGTELEVDMVMKCTGIWVNSHAYKDSLSESVDEKGQLKVNEYLQVEGQDDIYAIGDCTNNKDKLAYAAGEQATLLYSNFQRHYSRQKMTPWRPEKVLKAIGVASLGPTSGVGQMRGGTLLPEFAIKMLKSKDMMVSKFWKENGLPVPTDKRSSLSSL